MATDKPIEFETTSHLPRPGASAPLTVNDFALCCAVVIAAASLPGIGTSPEIFSRQDKRNAPIGLCVEGGGPTCVIDGDTIRHNGFKIRISDIDTPEIRSPKCEIEERLGHRAKERLIELLNAGAFEVIAIGRDEDRYGRKLRELHRHGHSLGEVLVAEGLAHPWRGRKESWC